MGIFNFEDFKLNERLGVSYASLLFSDFLEDFILKEFLQFVSSSETYLDEFKTIKWWKLQKWLSGKSTEEKNEFWKLYPEFPIAGYEVILKFHKVTPKFYQKNYTEDGPPVVSGGFASGFGHKNWKNYSKIVDPIRKISDVGLIIQFGIDIDFDKVNLDIKNPEHLIEIKKQIGSTLYHELNHCYEHYKRTTRSTVRGVYGKPFYDRSFNTAITFANENKWKVPKPIWNFWNKMFLNYTYMSEPFELNANVQEMYYHIKQFPNKELKQFTIWREADYMEKFDAEKFYSELVYIINQQPNMGNFIFSMIDDPNKIIDKLKDMWSQVYKREVELWKAKPMISYATLEKMSGLDFIKYWGRRFNENGRYLKGKISALKYEEILKNS